MSVCRRQHMVFQGRRGTDSADTSGTNLDDDIKRTFNLGFRSLVQLEVLVVANNSDDLHDCCGPIEYLVSWPCSRGRSSRQELLFVPALLAGPRFTGAGLWPRIRVSRGAGSSSHCTGPDVTAAARVYYSRRRGHRAQAPSLSCPHGWSFL